MVVHRSRWTDERLDELAERVTRQDVLEVRFDSLERRFDAIENRLEAFQTEMREFRRESTPIGQQSSPRFLHDEALGPGAMDYRRHRFIADVR